MLFYPDDLAIFIKGIFKIDEYAEVGNCWQMPENTEYIDYHTC